LDPVEIRREQSIDAAVSTITLHVGSTPRYEANQEVALFGGNVERTAGVAETGVPELIDSSREQLLWTDDVDDRVGDVELASQIVI
jgi:hypothetical protein